jgi:hypothetical protein
LNQKRIGLKGILLNSFLSFENKFLLLLKFKK